MDPEMRDERRRLARALRRGWIGPDAVADWLADALGERVGLLDEALRRGVLDAGRVTQLRGDTAPSRPVPSAPSAPLPGSATRPYGVRDGARDDQRAAVGPAHEGEGPSGSEPGSESHSELPASVCIAGRYALGEEVGRGGMGVIYTARDLALARTVALKTLPTGSDPALVESLLREARTTGRLDHPGIMPVFDLGIDAEGRVFYTMPLVSGRSLQAVLRELRRATREVVRDFTLTRRLQLFLQLCMAVHYAHSRGIVHRDIKPSNVLLGEFGEVLLLDWGIALHVGPEGRIRPGSGLVETPSERQILIGTPHYMAPEQASGNVDGLDIRCDVFALGVILFELVTLSLPFDEPDTERYLERVRTGPLPSPSVRSRGARVPEDLERIIRSATAHDRRERYQDAHALWQDVERFVEGSEDRVRARARAEEALLLGQAAHARFDAVLDERDALHARLRSEARTLDAWAPRERWEAFDRERFRSEGLEFLLAQRFAAASAHFRRALADAPDCVPARRALGALYRHRLATAEEHRDVADMTYFGGLVQHFEEPIGEAEEQRTGVLSIRTFPEGGRVSLLGVAELEDDPGRAEGTPLGRAPVEEVRVPIGMHLLIVRAEGYRETRYPVFVRSGPKQYVLVSLEPWSAALPHVGREGEMAQLAARLDNAIEHRRPRVALVVGAPGMGRTKLLQAFGAHVERRPDPIVFTFVRCLPVQQGVPYRALSEVLRFRAGIHAGDTRESVRSKLRDQVRAVWTREGLAALTPEDERRIGELADQLATLPGLEAMPAVPPVSGAPPWKRAAEALDAYLLRLGSLWPIVMIFEDAHWMDGSSRRFLERFVAARRVPLLVVASATGTRGDHRLAALGGLARHLTLDLPPLGHAAVSQLMAALLKGHPREDLVRRIRERSHGNPLLVEELTRHLVETGGIRIEDGEWRLVGRSRSMPDVDVACSNLARLGALPSAVRDLLQAAAVVGRVFWRDALPGPPAPAREEALAEAVRREILVAVPYSRYPESPEYEFRVEPLWRLAYAAVPLEQRRLAHRAVAAWLGRRVDASFEHRARLAVHLDRARDPERAAALHTELARTARDLGAPREARYHFDRVLAYPLPETLRRAIAEEADG